MAQRKYKQADLIQLLKTLTGEDVEVVGDDATDYAEPSMDEILQLVDSARSPIISQKLSSELEKTLHKSITGKTTATHIKTLTELTGISPDELKDKPAKEATEIALKHYAAKLGTSQATAAEQLREVTEAHAKAMQKLEDERKADRANYEREISEYGISNILQGLYSSAKGIDPDPAVKSLLQQDFTQHLNSNYIVKLSPDKKSISLYNKNEPDKLAMNESGTQLLKLEDLHKNYHTQRKQWNEDNRSSNPATELKETSRLDNKQLMQPVYGQASNDSKALGEIASWIQGSGAAV